MNDALIRFSVAIDAELLRQFDRYCATHSHPNRSEAVRGLMIAALAEDVLSSDEAPALGVLTLVYDHHRRQVTEHLTELQHAHLDRVVSTTHVHLDAERCLEVILLTGTAREVRELADALIGTKGVESGRLVLAPARSVTATHSHGHEHGHPHTHPHSHSHDQEAKPKMKLPTKLTGARRTGRRRPKLD